MNLEFSFGHWRYLVLLLVWIGFNGLSAQSNDNKDESINLALRKTADILLKRAGDSTSRIPSVRKVAPNKFRLDLPNKFQYKDLVGVVDDVLIEYGISAPYQIAIKNCQTGILDLGFNKQDLQSPDGVACENRVMPEGCHYMELTLPSENNKFQKIYWSGGLALGLIVVFLLLQWKFSAKKTPSVNNEDPTLNETQLIQFGQSILDPEKFELRIGQQSTQLTYRECKLLKLLASRPNQILSRDEILKNVWEDEGIVVGRSLDVFVSRLRKKLAEDKTVAISVAHGIGYKLETTKVERA